MDLKNQLYGNFPKTIDKKKPVFSSLVANDDKTAVIQKQLEDLFKYMKEWISTPDVYKQSGVMLDKTIRFFSFLEPFADESEKSIKNRFAAIFVRNHDQKWGTPFDVKNVFRQYFPSAEIFLIENTNKIDSTDPVLGNLISDGDINESVPTDWTLTNCSATTSSRFSKSYGIEFNQSNSVASQSVSLPIKSIKEGGVIVELLPTSFFLHFFLNGDVNVIIKDGNNKYWDYQNKTWKTSEVKNNFTTAIKDSEGNITSYEWKNISMFFTIPEPSSETETVTISFEMNGVGQKAAVNVKFTRDNDLLPDNPNNDPALKITTIPAGTRVSDGTYTFITTEDAVIRGEDTVSDFVTAVAENFGFDYFAAANTITTIESSVPQEVISVNNPYKAFGGTFLDYFRLFQKQHYGSFTVIAHFDGNTSSKAFGLAAGDDDPNVETESETPPQPRYSNYGYYDKSFLSGVPLGFAKDIYEDLLDYLRAQGVMAFLDIVIRDYTEE